MADDPQDWKESLSEDLRSHPVFEKFKLGEGEALVGVPPSLIKSHAEQQKLVGRDKIPVPPENATDEDWGEVWSRLGRPETPEGYELKIAEDLPDIVKNDIDEDLMSGFRGICHKAGIIPAQAQMVLDWFLPANAKKKEQRDQEGEEFRQRSEATLRKEWGRAYDEKIMLSQNTFAHFAAQLGEERCERLMNLMDDSDAGNDPLLLALFAQIGDAIGEDVIAGKATTSFALTPEQAGTEITKIFGDKDHPYHHKDHPEHKMAVQRMAELHEMEAAAESAK